MIELAVLLAWHGLCDLHAQLPNKHERWWAMALHAGAHALAPAVLLGWQFGIAELVSHALIDTGKGQRWYGTAVDQSLHVVSKAAWVLLA